jgi:hypothetical protein
MTVAHSTRGSSVNGLWSAHNAAWRAPEQAATFWREASAIDPRLLRGRAYGAWWETIGRLRITLLVSREYEHLLLAMTMTAQGRR